MEVQRSTLLTFDGTSIADMFKDGCECNLPRDGRGRIMIDCRADVFVPLINLLRQCRLERERAHGEWRVPIPRFLDPKLNEEFCKALHKYGLSQCVRNDCFCSATNPAQDGVRQHQEKLQERKPDDSKDGRPPKASIYMVQKTKKS